MPLNDNGSNSISASRFTVNQNDRKQCRLLIIPGHPVFGDLREAWFHTITGLPQPGKNRPDFFGYERCISQGKNDMSCPMCRDRKRFSSNLRRACNVYDFTDQKVKVLIQGPKVWGQIIEQLNAQVGSLNAMMEQQGRPSNFDVYTAAAYIDIFISRDGNNQYTVSSSINFSAIQFDESMLHDLSALEEFELKTPEYLLNVVQMANTPQQATPTYGANPGGLGGGVPQAPVPPYGAPAPGFGVPTTPPPAAPTMPAPGMMAPPATVTIPSIPAGTPAMPFQPPVVPGAPTVAVPPPPAAVPPPAAPAATTATISGISLEDARSMACNVGKYQGMTIGEIADTDPKYLLSYLNTGNSKLPEGSAVRQAVSVVAATLSDKFTSENTAAVADMSTDANYQDKLGKITAAAANEAVAWDAIAAAITALGTGKSALNQLSEAELDTIITNLNL